MFASGPISWHLLQGADVNRIYEFLEQDTQLASGPVSGTRFSIGQPFTLTLSKGKNEKKNQI